VRVVGKAAAGLPHSKSLLGNLVRDLAKCALGAAKRIEEMNGNREIHPHATTRGAQRAVPLQEIHETWCGFAASLFWLEAADFGVAWFEDLVDKIAALVIRQKGAFHGVDGEDFEIVQAEAKGVSCGLEFFGHCGVAHQAVVGV